MEHNITITGLAGRFPGANAIQDFWSLLQKQQSGVFASARWDKIYHGGFLKDIDQIDAEFFHLSPKEAKLMDPQQRLLLETAWSAFEDAGFSKENLKGKKAGVFVTSLPGDYKNLISDSGSAPDAKSFTGNAVSLYAGHLSYFFDLKGPSLYIDTACSSGLVCIDQALRSLNEGTIDLALVGGVSVFSTPQMFELASAAGILSKSALCCPFDARADGFVPAEMVVCLVLQREQDASYTPYGFVRKTTVNHDGLSNGIMAPNRTAQEALLKEMYQDINLSDVGYIEAHGTGTQLGDPIELRALHNVFAGRTSLTIGSLKANIGHGLVASSLASIVKALGIFQTDCIPPQANFHTLNTHTPQDFFEIPQAVRPLPKENNLIGVSAFGFGGTNAHVVLARFPEKRMMTQPSTQFQKQSYWIQEAKPTAHVQPSLITTLCNLLDYEEKRLPRHTPLSNLGVDSLVVLKLLDHLPLSLKNLPSDQLLAKTVSELLSDAVPEAPDALSLEWTQEGEKTGPVLILLPPLNTLAPIWIQQMRFFRTYRILIPHYPGHGQSPYHDLSLENLSGHLIRDLAILKVPKAHFVGWSLGGCLSLLIALRQPELINSLTLVSTAAHFEQDLFDKAPLLKADLASYTPYLRHLFNVQDTSSKFSAQASLEILGHYYQELAAFSVLKRLAQLTQPCLIIHGENDAVIQKHHLDGLKHIANASLKMFETHGHFVPLTAPWHFNKTLDTFLRKHDHAH